MEARWEQLVLSWEWMTRAYDRGPDTCLGGLVRLLKAVRAEPRLSRLYPFTSHHHLHLSLSTSFPWARPGVPFVEPLDGGGYHLRRLGSGEVVGRADTPEGAVALLLADLPADLGPVFNHPPESDR